MQSAQAFTAWGPEARLRAPVGSRGKAPGGGRPRKLMGYSTLKLLRKAFLALIFEVHITYGKH